jgi:hypothetical protein
LPCTSTPIAPFSGICDFFATSKNLAMCLSS